MSNLAPKEHYFVDLYIGQSSSFKFKITNEIYKNFLKISSDYNPIHTEKSYAIKHGFDDKIMHGLLTSSFYSKFIGMNLPGKYSVLNEINIKFMNPVYLNDILLIKGTIISKHENFKVITINSKITNINNNLIVSKANIKVMLIS